MSRKLCNSNDIVIAKIISITLHLYLDLGLALSEYKQWQSLGCGQDILE